MTAVWAPAGLADSAFDGGRLVVELERVIARSPMEAERRRTTSLSTRELRVILDGLPGEALQDRWSAFEWGVWPEWLRGVGRAADRRWSFGVALLVTAQAVRPSWPFLECTYTRRWVKHLPDDAPLQIAANRLRPAVEAVAWSSMALREKAVKNGLRIMMVAGYTALEQITDPDLRSVPVTVSSGSDVLDAALCSLGVLGRTPLRGAARRMRNRRLTPGRAGRPLADPRAIPCRARALPGAVSAADL